MFAEIDFEEFSSIKMVYNIFQSSKILTSGPEKIIGTHAG